MQTFGTWLRQEALLCLLDLISFSDIHVIYNLQGQQTRCLYLLAMHLQTLTREFTQCLVHMFQVMFCRGKIEEPALIVTPSSLMTSWMEVRRIAWHCTLTQPYHCEAGIYLMWLSHVSGCIWKERSKNHLWKSTLLLPLSSHHQRANQNAVRYCKTTTCTIFMTSAHIVYLNMHKRVKGSSVQC